MTTRNRTVKRTSLFSLIPLLALAGVLGATGSAPADAQESDLAPTVVADMEAAAEQGDTLELAAIVVGAIGQTPAEAETIIAKTAELDPAHAAQIARVASQAFPSLAERIAAALDASRATVATAETTAAPATDPEAEVGEVATEAAAPPVEEVAESPWSGEAELGISRTTGNTEQAALGARARVKHETTLWRNLLKANFDVAEEKDEKIQERFISSFETNYKFLERAYAFGFIEYEEDRFSGFDYRLTQSAGLGYRVVDEPDLTFDVEAGPGLRITEFEDRGDTEREFVGRLATDFIWRFSDDAELTNEAQVVTGRENTTIRSLSALTSDITDDLALRVSYDIRRDTNVEPNREKTDTITKVSLVYSLMGQ